MVDKPPSIGPGLLTFWWKVSSEGIWNYDFLTFYIDTNRQGPDFRRG